MRRTHHAIEDGDFWRTKGLPGMSLKKGGQRPFRPALRRIAIQAVSIGRFMTIAWSFFMVST